MKRKFKAAASILGIAMCLVSYVCAQENSNNKLRWSDPHLKYEGALTINGSQIIMALSLYNLGDNTMIGNPSAFPVGFRILNKTDAVIDVNSACLGIMRKTMRTYMLTG